MTHAYLALMQTGREGDWSDAGVAQLLAGCNPGDDPHQVGVDWAHDIEPEGADWRILIWCGVNDGDYNLLLPDAIVTAEHLASRRVPTYASTRRSARPKHRLRVHVEPGQVVSKVRAAEDTILRRYILVTREKRNTTAQRSPGPWYPANEPGPDAVAAYVSGVGELIQRDRTTMIIDTPVGRMPFLPLNQSVILAEEF